MTASEGLRRAGTADLGSPWDILLKIYILNELGTNIYWGMGRVEESEYLACNGKLSKQQLKIEPIKKETIKFMIFLETLLIYTFNYY